MVNKAIQLVQQVDFSRSFLIIHAALHDSFLAEDAALRGQLDSKFGSSLAWLTMAKYQKNMAA